MELGKKIKEIRKKKKISQKNMAEKLEISLSSYSKIEQNIIAISIERFIKICGILNIQSYDDLLNPLADKVGSDFNETLTRSYLSINNLLSNFNYNKILIERLLNKAKSEQLEQKELIKDLELTLNYFEVIEREIQDIKNFFSESQEQGDYL